MKGWSQSKKQYSVVDMAGDRSKVWCCKEQYCIGTWNVRSKNQGKLEVVKQEMARVNINILGISELKWTGMGEFSSDDHYIYYCRKESLRRNGVAMMANKRVRNSVLGCSLKNDRMISVQMVYLSFFLCFWLLSNSLIQFLLMGGAVFPPCYLPGAQLRVIGLNFYNYKILVICS